MPRVVSSGFKESVGYISISEGELVGLGLGKLEVPETVSDGEPMG